MAGFFIFSLNPADYDKIDQRFDKYLKGWKLVEYYKGDMVVIPDDWKSDIFPYRYFEVVKKPGDVNFRPDEQENEKCLCLWAGWKGYDDECDIRLWIRGKNVLDTTKTKVSAEIFKTGGAPMKLFFNDILVTNFTKRLSWFGLCAIDKFWIDDLSSLASN